MALVNIDSEPGLVQVTSGGDNLAGGYVTRIALDGYKPEISLQVPPVVYSISQGGTGGITTNRSDLAAPLICSETNLSEIAETGITVGKASGEVSSLPLENAVSWRMNQLKNVSIQMTADNVSTGYWPLMRVYTATWSNPFPWFEWQGEWTSPGVPIKNLQPGPLSLIGVPSGPAVLTQTVPLLAVPLTFPLYFPQILPPIAKRMPVYPCIGCETSFATGSVSQRLIVRFYPTNSNLAMYIADSTKQLDFFLTSLADIGSSVQ